MHRKWSILLPFVLLLAACVNDQADFREAAELTIEGEDAAAELGQSFTVVACETPASVEVGTKFTCTARGNEDGVLYRFTAEIDAENRVAVDAAIVAMDG